MVKDVQRVVGVFIYVFSFEKSEHRQCDHYIEFVNQNTKSSVRNNQVVNKRGTAANFTLFKGWGVNGHRENA